MNTILFVCTGNVFRSLTADMALAREIRRQGLESSVTAASAGLNTEGAHLVPELRTIWGRHGLDAGDHVPTQVTPEIIGQASVVIAMAENHQELLHAEYGCDAPLFNRLAIGQDRSVDDLGEALPDFRERPEDARRFLSDTVDHIVRNTPALLQAIRAAQA